MMADCSVTIPFACGKPHPYEDTFGADGAFTFLPAICSDGDHRWRAGVTRLHTQLPVWPISVEEPFFRFYEDVFDDLYIS